MIFEEKTIQLKDGSTAVLKTPCTEDVEQMLHYLITVCGETDFLSRYPEERSMTLQQEEAWINRLRTSPDTLGIACYLNGKVTGCCEINFLNGLKMCHRAAVHIALLRDYWNLGIGSTMFREMINAAQSRGTEIMELAFLEGNHRAKYLYEKFGFRVVAEIPKAYKRKDGTYQNEYHMQKYL